MHCTDGFSCVPKLDVLSIHLNHSLIAPLESVITFYQKKKKKKSDLLSMVREIRSMYIYVPVLYVHVCVCMACVGLHMVCSHVCVCGGGGVGIYVWGVRLAYCACTSLCVSVHVCACARLYKCSLYGLVPGPFKYIQTPLHAK